MTLDSSTDLIPLEIGITSVYEGKDPAIDIICVHGLNSTPERCWKRNNILWLRDLLPRESRLMNVRIATFGYNSKITTHKASNARIRDHATHLLQDVLAWRHGQTEAQRPIIFICHSLGGIVVKRALVIAQQNSSYRVLLESTTGIVFLGTPHKGSQLANLGQKLAKTAGVAFQAKPHLLKSLKEDSEQLQDLSEEFKNLHSLFQIVSCYEMKPTVFKKGPFRMTEIVVTESSAKLGIPEETLVGINTDHHDICKFSHASDPEYIKVKSRIIDLVKTAPNIVKARLTPSSAPKPPNGSSSPTLLPSINSQLQSGMHQVQPLSINIGNRDSSAWPLPGAKANTQARDDSNALQAAAFYGHEALIRHLLDQGDNFSYASGDLNAAFQTAAFYGHESVVRLLLDRGADINANGGTYGTALHGATLQPHRLEVIRILLDRGANVNAKGGIHGSVLQGAVLQPHCLEVVQLLLDRGADVNAQSGNTCTALHGAVLFSNYEVARILMDWGADVNASRGNYGSVLQTAKMYRMPNQEAIIKMLRDAGARD